MEKYKISGYKGGLVGAIHTEHFTLDLNGISDFTTPENIKKLFLDNKDNIEELRKLIKAYNDTRIRIGLKTCLGDIQVVDILIQGDGSNPVKASEIEELKAEIPATQTPVPPPKFPIASQKTSIEKQAAKAAAEEEAGTDSELLTPLLTSSHTSMYKQEEDKKKEAQIEMGQLGKDPWDVGGKRRTKRKRKRKTKRKRKSIKKKRSRKLL